MREFPELFPSLSLKRVSRFTEKDDYRRPAAEKILPAVETRSTVSGNHLFKWTSVLHSHLPLQQLAAYTRIRTRVPGRLLEIWIKFPV